jgi:hypothetical protein
MNKTFEFGKIDYNNSGRKENLVTVEIELTDKDKPKFSASGNIWNRIQTDILCGGQNLDELKEYINTPLFNEIYRLWKLYHLNGMNAGTPIQSKAIENWESMGNTYDYNKACEYLKSIGLYNDEGYVYGTSWLYREIPANDLNKIKALFN